ncbi:MAG: DUF898 domain-containing protein [Treponema sp.]|jgi:uncharacterized membrane protein YjgN (DUF898 family)|nr:DUF898 domain-containing protein [Treponema sp.]
MAKELDKATDSYFDGGVLQLIGWSILGSLVTFCTLFICFPVAVCWNYRWQINHTVVNGRRLKFNGKAGSLLGHWILWELLIIITFGIFGLWVPVKIEKWKARNTTFADA